jgi:hypothetical protein
MDREQAKICLRYDAVPTPASPSSKLGISDSALRGDLPLNGLRHPPEAGTNGWYIWGGEYSTSPEFFKPLHVSNLKETCPLAVPYLALSPGWRFLVTPDYEDVWFDSQLLTTN